MTINYKLVIFIITSFFIVLGSQASANMALSCHHIFLAHDQAIAAKLQQAQQRLQKKHSFVVDADDGFIGLSNPVTEVSMGYLEYTYSPKSKTLFLNTYDVPSEFKGVGVSRVLLGEALKRHPEAEVLYIETISMDNMDVYRNAKLAGEKTVEAFKNTPAYKVNEFYGFSKVKVTQDKNGDVTAVAVRP